MARNEENFDKIIAELEEEEKSKTPSPIEKSSIEKKEEDEEIEEIDLPKERLEDGGGIDPIAGMDDAVGVDDGGLGDGGLDDGFDDGGLDDGINDGGAGEDDVIIQEGDVSVDDGIDGNEEGAEMIDPPKTNIFENVLGNIFNWYE